MMGRWWDMMVMGRGLEPRERARVAQAAEVLNDEALALALRRGGGRE